ncbi:MAG: branched-chain amino acid transaminase [Chloroflexota bacterium]|nr:branched-chain amino acid transaminase [Chloroflexota bacterium]
MPQSYAFFQGKFMPLSEAKIGVMTHALHYGTAIFEGIRGNWNPEQKQTYLFRPREHYERMHRGCQVMKLDIPYTAEKMCDITVELVAKCAFEEDIYIRPLAYKSSESLYVRLHDLDSDFLVFVIPWGPYIKVDKAKCGVSSWRRPNDDMIPPQAKITGIYANSALAKTEAHDNGFHETIMLCQSGYVSEGSGENIFLVIDDKLVTPATYSSILMGITRDTVIKLAKNELGMDVVERPVDRSELYVAKEAFMTGTAANITAVTEIDHRKVGDGEVGEITRKLQNLYSSVIRGRNPKYMEWCTPVYKR